MKLVKRGEGNSATAPGHVNQLGFTKLVAGQDTQRLNFSVSHYLPGGHVSKGAAPGEIIYYVIAGSYCVTGQNEEYVLEPGDTLYIPAGEERESKAVGSEPTTIIVVFSPNPA